MITSDILVIGGGIAGLSAAASLSEHASVLVIEAEEQIGYHSSGRSATMVHYALGDRLVRALTLASRPFFDSPPAGFTDAPLGHRMPVLVHGRSGSTLAECPTFARSSKTMRCTASPTATAHDSIRTHCFRRTCGYCERAAVSCTPVIESQRSRGRAAHGQS